MGKKDAKLFIKTPPEPKEIKLQKKTRERRSQNIWTFFDTHPAINVRSIAKEVDYLPGNFDKYKRNKKTLPQHLLLKVENVLTKYGLNVT